MRCIGLVILASALTACSTAPQPETRSVKAEAHLQKLLAGKAAGAPVACLPSQRSKDMIVVDDNTIAFRDGSNRTFVNQLQGGGCSNLGSGFYALVTRNFGGSGMCRGDIAEVADISSGMTVGSCVLGDFVPYASPAG